MSFEYNPHISIDCVLFGFDEDRINVLLIKRRQQGRTVYALPGDLVKKDEDLQVGADRILYELTGMKNVYLEQFYTFGEPDRINDPVDIEWLNSIREHPEARVITIGYYAIINVKDYDLHPSSFAEAVIWHPVEEELKLAFDHNRILHKAWEMLRHAIRFRPEIAFQLLPEKFTLSQVQALYEAIVGGKLDKRNFRKRILKQKFLKPLDEWEQDVAHKPARYYQFDEAAYQRIFGKDKWFLF